MILASEANDFSLTTYVMQMWQTQFCQNGHGTQEAVGLSENICANIIATCRVVGTISGIELTGALRGFFFYSDVASLTSRFLNAILVEQTSAVIDK